MQFNQTDFTGLFPIQSYEKDKVKVNDQFFNHSLLIRNGQLPEKWSVDCITNLTLPSLLILFEDKPEVVLLGSGTTLVFPALSLLQEINQRKMAIEVMDTGAACRTYNVLLAEGRRVTAGLFLHNPDRVYAQ